LISSSTGASVGLVFGLGGALILDSVLPPGWGRVLAVATALVVPLAVCMAWQLRAIARRGHPAS
jgi:hypothetical protein